MGGGLECSSHRRPESGEVKLGEDSAKTRVETSAVATNGWTLKKCGLSRDCLAVSPCAKAWQRLGCTASMPTQSAIADPSTDIDAMLFVLPAAVRGHAYDATASCMNSILNSAIHIATTRDEREIVIVTLVFARFIIRSTAMHCQATHSTNKDSRIGLSTSNRISLRTYRPQPASSGITKK
jgi:hypothetical protein